MKGPILAVHFVTDGFRLKRRGSNIYYISPCSEKEAMSHNTCDTSRY